jgi:NAD(P)-dependent dehydrogenase (short-subunit alcohol dehydrogenase family)
MLQNPDWGLVGKVCVVTGAGRGLGRAIARSLAGAGAKLVIVSRTESELRELAHELEGSGCEALAIPIDVSDPAQVNQMADEALRRFGTIDVLVNNAAITIRKPFLEQTVEDIEKVIGINLIGYLLCAQAVGRTMVENKSGKIINIGSEVGIVGTASGAVPYSASKGGIAQFTRCLAVEWAKYNINVNCIAPSLMWTPMVEERLKDPKYLEWVINKIPMGRVPKPEEVADMVLVMASRYSSFVTGHVLMVDGGYTIV